MIRASPPGPLSNIWRGGVRLGTGPMHGPWTAACAAMTRSGPPMVPPQCGGRAQHTVPLQLHLYLPQSGGHRGAGGLVGLSILVDERYPHPSL